MANVHELKEHLVLETPLLLFECRLKSGVVERWSTHAAEVDGQTYEARVLRHNLFEMRSGSDEGVDGLARVSLTLANADGRLSQMERQTGWKGARVTVRFVFYDLHARSAASDVLTLFQGAAGAPDEITEGTLRLTLTNRLNLQRVMLPNVRIQRRCPWVFPETAGERAEAVSGGDAGQYSLSFRCGYSPDVEGGVGSLEGSAPYRFCDYTRGECEARGMFDQDAAGRATRRFGGVEFVPPTIQVRSFGEGGSHGSAAAENEVRYSDFVPLVYGTAWFQPPIVFARNDGNLTRVEVLLGMGEIQGVVKVVANNVEIPLGQAGQDMTGTGWYNLVTAGNRTGGFNLDFTDGAGRPLGDPYGSMAMMSVVLPNRLADGRSLPKIEVLLEGLKLPRYDLAGMAAGTAFSNNPAWVLLDVLRRCGWGGAEIDAASFARAAQHCDELVDATDLNGNDISVARYQCNLVLRKRRSAAELVRGIRNGAGLLLRLGADGRLELIAEEALTVQNTAKPEGSNASEPLMEGWPAYEFGDGSTPAAGILRRESGESTVRLWSRPTADCPNRVNVEFQDAFNDYQQDSLSLVDVDDARATGQEMGAALNALGLANLDQALRVAWRQLKRWVEGNVYVEFETSVRALHLRPGDLITLTYQQEGFNRKLFRILSIAPGLNFGTARITAQIHKEEWYAGGLGNSGLGVRRQAGAGLGIPRPLVGDALNEQGEPVLGISESAATNTDGSASVKLAVGFVEPARPAACEAAIPLLSLSPVTESTGGTLAGGQTLYYAISAVDGTGRESALSFVVRASLPEAGATCRVRLTKLSFSAGTAGFHVYRGKSPSQLRRIASEVAVAAWFEDAGASAQPVGPPDANFDHANFYWRLELAPDCQATSFSATSIGNASLGMLPDERRGAAVRITGGRGAGQERRVTGNDAATLSVEPAWHITPDATSTFVVAESGWRFGAAAQTSPVEIEVPNRQGVTIQVSGRSANVHDRECAYELSPLARWRILGASGSALDSDVPEAPHFALFAGGRGSVELVGVAFQNLANTRSVNCGTLALHYWDELSSPAATRLAAAVGAEDDRVELTAAVPAVPGGLIQAEAEIMVVEAVENGGLRCRVARGSHGSSAAAHPASAAVYCLRRKVFVMSFPRDFFGSPASGSFSYSALLPDVRVAAGEFFVTNDRGNSPTRRVNWARTVDGGLRTLSGGQIVLQVEGPLAVESDATPPLAVQDSHSVYDIFGMVQEAPQGAPVLLRILQDGEAYCDLTIAAGETVSNVAGGFGMPPLRANARLSLDILSVGQGGDTTPGRDLTVTIRL